MLAHPCWFLLIQQYVMYLYVVSLPAIAVYHTPMLQAVQES